MVTSCMFLQCTLRAKNHEGLAQTMAAEEMLRRRAGKVVFIKLGPSRGRDPPPEVLWQLLGCLTTNQALDSDQDQLAERGQPVPDGDLQRPSAPQNPSEACRAVDILWKPTAV